MLIRQHWPALSKSFEAPTRTLQAFDWESYVSNYIYKPAFLADSLDLLERPLANEVINRTYRYPHKNFSGNLLHVALSKNKAEAALAILRRVDFRGVADRTGSSLTALHLAAFHNLREVCFEILAITGPWFAAVPMEEDAAIEQLSTSQFTVVKFPKGWRPADVARRMGHSVLAALLEEVASVWANT